MRVMMMVSIEVGAFGTVSQRHGKKSERTENQWKNQDYPDNSIVKIVLNTEKDHGDSRRLVVS